MRKLWSNTRVRRVRKKEQAEDSSYPKVIEVMRRKTVRKSYPKNVDNPTTASRDCDVRQSARDWSFRIKIPGHDPQIYFGTFLFF